MVDRVRLIEVGGQPYRPEGCPSGLGEHSASLAQAGAFFFYGCTAIHGPCSLSEAGRSRGSPRLARRASKPGSRRGWGMSCTVIHGPCSLSEAGRSQTDLWIKSAAAGSGGRRPQKTLAFLGVAQVEKGHGRLFPRATRFAAPRTPGIQARQPSRLGHVMHGHPWPVQPERGGAEPD
jgi:hypothetical protein